MAKPSVKGKEKDEAMLVDMSFSSLLYPPSPFGELTSDIAVMKPLPARSTASYSQAVIVMLPYLVARFSRKRDVRSRCICSPPISLFLPLLLLSFLVVPVYASPLKIVSLNCHSLGAASVAKLDGITDFMDRIKPHLLILFECGHSAKSLFPWSHSEYVAYLWPLRLASNPSCSIAMFVRVDVTVVRRVDPMPRFIGRMAGIDVVFEGSDRSRVSLRVIGVYAPTAKSANLPKNQLNTAAEDHPRDIEDFWRGLTDFVGQTPKWVIAGDANTSLHPWEITGYGDAYLANVLPKTRSCYRRFLTDTSGLDAWEEQQSVDVWRDWTYRDFKDGGRKHVLDRAASSQNVSIQFSSALEEVNGTDHRPLFIKILLGVKLAPNLHTYTPLPGRLWQPRDRNDPSFIDFEQRLSLQMRPYHDATVNTTRQFDRLLKVADAELLSANKLNQQLGTFQPRYRPKSSP